MYLAFLPNILFLYLNLFGGFFCLLHISGHEIVPNTGANATKFYHFGDQILKISCQIGD